MQNIVWVEDAYESAVSPKLLRHVPIIVRVDACDFSRQTKELPKPWDSWLVDAFAEITRLLAQRFGCVIGYSSGGEISLLRLDFMTLDRHPQFNNDIQRYCSTIASAAALYFNRCLAESVKELRATSEGDNALGLVFDGDNEREYLAHYEELAQRDIFFHAQAFNVPMCDVCRYFQGRQSRGISTLLQLVARKVGVDPTGLSIKELSAVAKENGIDWQNSPWCYAPNGMVARLDKSEEPHKFITVKAPSFWEDDSEYLKSVITSCIKANNATALYSF